MSFMLYAAETEGDIPTRRGKIQNLIKKMRQHPDPFNPEICEAIVASCGLDLWDLSDAEKEYIILEVDR